MTARKNKYTKKELEYFKTILVEKKLELVRELGYIEDSNLFQGSKDQSGEPTGLSNHLADAAADFTSLETNFDLAEREGKYLVYIEEALQRIKDGTYGICKDCIERPNSLSATCPLIPKARLEAVPTATRCVHCKQVTKKQEEKDLQNEMARMYLAQHQKRRN